MKGLAALAISQKGDCICFAVRVQPRASQDEIVGLYQHALKIRLIVPPVDNRANEALRELLASRLKVPLAAVRIAAGGGSRVKRVEVRGVTPAKVLALAN